MIHKIKILSFFLSMLILFASCASTTLIQTTPSKAKVYLNDAYIGTSPVSYTDTKIVGTCTAVRIEKEGYQPLNTYLCRNEEVDVGAVIGGIFVLFPFLWTMKYFPHHHYELKPFGEPLPESRDYYYYDEPPVEEIQLQPLIQKSKTEKLRELKELFDEGILTQEEFDKEKQKILNE